MSNSDTLDPGGPVAREMAELWWVLLAMGTVTFLIFAVMLGVGLFRRRGGADASDETVERRQRRWVAGGGVVLPVVGVVAVLGFTLASMEAIPDDDIPDDALVIDVIGHQWWWEVRYPDYDVVTANEITIPVDRPVAFRITSADVIHSFWVPALAGKLDAMPDYVNTLVFAADETGTFQGHCAEFCGLQHANMGFVVFAVPPAEFDGWVSAHAEIASPPQSPAARAGQAVFTQADCASCHTIRGTSARGDGGPDLTHLRDRSTIGATTLTNTPEHMAEWITDPHQFKPGISMEPVELSDEELANLMAYLETLE